MSIGRFAENKHRDEGDWSYATGMLEVVGTFYREQNFISFANAAAAAEKNNNLYGLRLVPEPNNHVDKNAIKVIGFIKKKGLFGGLLKRNWHIGYVDAITAKVINKNYLSHNVNIIAELNSIYSDGRNEFRPPWYKILAPKIKSISN